MARTLTHGVVYFNNGRNSRACAILDLGYEGARIVVSNPIGIPDLIELFVPEKQRLRHALVRWRHGNRLGLVFLDARRVGADGPHAGHSPTP